MTAGRLTRAPSTAETAARVARFRDHPVPGMLESWAAVAPQYEEIIGAFGVWPAVIDVASQEQDIRGALGRPGARDAAVIWHCAGELLRWLRPPVPTRVLVDDTELLLGAGEGSDGGGAELALRTSRFEAFRWRAGRRSLAQLAALDWSGDPSPVLDGLAVFGPSLPTSPNRPAPGGSATGAGMRGPRPAEPSRAAECAGGPGKASAARLR